MPRNQMKILPIYAINYSVLLPGMCARLGHFVNIVVNLLQTVVYMLS